jgi:hypothetical protein
MEWAVRQKLDGPIASLTASVACDGSPAAAGCASGVIGAGASCCPVLTIPLDEFEQRSKEQDLEILEIAAGLPVAIL